MTVKRFFVLLLTAACLLAGSLVPAGLTARSLTPGGPGDPDGSGSVTSTDARLTLQCAVGKIGRDRVMCPAAMEVDGDGDVTSTDARLILQYAVGKILRFPGETEERVGAAVPFTTYEAEAALMAGGAEPGADPFIKEASSGKQYAHLPSPGSSVTFTAGEAADRITLRYSAPYRSEASLALEGAGQRVTLTLNTVQCHGVGDSGAPDDGVRSYCEDWAALTLAPGDRVTVTNLAGDISLDLIDLETASPPLPCPENALNVTDFGALPGDEQDDADGLEACIASAKEQGKDVYLPAGAFLQSRRISVPAGMAVTGAGVWYTLVEFYNRGTTYSNTSGYALSSGNRISDIRFNDRASRSRGTATILFRPLGNEQLIENCWFSNIGCVFGWDSRCYHVTFRNSRVIGTYFDGTHWGDGQYIENETHDVFFRGCGDDAIAQVNRADMGGCADNYAHHNSVIASYWGRGISCVGGDGLTLRYNLVDSSYLAGLIIATETLGPSHSRPIRGLTVEYNRFNLCGHRAFDEASVKASNHASIHISLATNYMQDVVIRNNQITNGKTSAIKIDRTQYYDPDALTYEGNAVSGF